MIFRRRHLQRNLIDRDTMISQFSKTSIGNDKVETMLKVDGLDFHGVLDDTFEITEFNITWLGYNHKFTDSDTSEVIEMSHYTNVISKDRQRVTCYRYEDINGFNFVLKEPLPTK